MRTSPLTDRSNVLFGTAYGLLWKIFVAGLVISAVCVALMLIITYWYVVLAVVLVTVGLFVWGHHRANSEGFKRRNPDF